MARHILVEEFHMSVFAPRGLAKDEYDIIRQSLDKGRFQSALRRAVKAVLKQFPSLGAARVTVTR